LSSLKNNKQIPVHGDGSYVRDWTYVKDNIRAIFYIIESGVCNETYNVAAENQMTNLEVVDTILKWNEKDQTSIKFVENRWGQDLRYSISSKKIRKLGWNPQYPKGIYKWF